MFKIPKFKNTFFLFSQTRSESGTFGPKMGLFVEMYVKLENFAHYFDENLPRLCISISITLPVCPLQTARIE